MKVKNRATRIDAQLVSSEKSTTSLQRVFSTYLFHVPTLTPVEKPFVTRQEAEASFSSRVGTATIFTFAYIEHALSPEGSLRAFLKVAARWFLFFLLIVIVLGVPTLLAAQFIEAVAKAIRLAMEHFLMAMLNLLGALVIAAAIAGGAVFLLNRK